MYKYSCRKCPVRSRCIDESDNSPSAKVMVRRAFEARTDTLSTWALLQKNCLLLKAEQERSSSALSDRLQNVRESKAQLGTGELELDKEQTDTTPKKPVIRRLRPQGKPASPGANTRTEKPEHTPDYLRPVSPTDKKRPIKPLKRLSPATQPSTTQAASTRPAVASTSKIFWLTINSTKRRITLPVTGQISFGHFDPNVGIPPDIDLTYEDRNSHYISRRHATIVANDGVHTIEDLGSKAGVYLNGKRIDNGPSPSLKSGDRINLGNIELVYERVPGRVLESVKSGRTRHTLLITPTGRKMTIVPNRNLIIGHADPQVNFMPDVDLSNEGEVARLVSRRHAVIQWQDGQPYIEDLGSGFGTRLGGELLILGQAVPLKPGDHIWLAGCVLAYDVDV